MNTRNVLVVGDKFAAFAKGKDALTVSQLNSLLTQEKLDIPSFSQITLIPGQGMGDRCVSQLLENANSSIHRQYFDFSLWHGRPSRADSKLSHKENTENILISQPRCLYDRCYSMQLMVDENCELMSDHQSGQHVQGMVLFEAARQSLLVVTEAFYIQDSEEKYAFVFNRMSVNYAQFAFPFDAELIYEIKEKNIRKKTRMSFVVDIRIEQCGVAIASFDAEFSVFKSELISTRERTLAEKALIAHMQNNVSSPSLELRVNG